jgi:hypothetical protein
MGALRKADWPEAKNARRQKMNHHRELPRAKKRENLSCCARRSQACLRFLVLSGASVLSSAT